ncbi:MAG: hypothetical protein H7343_04655 [Undibacterium sp.]|nr:hypothetical protein [Opitutaceae bacterium]
MKSSSKAIFFFFLLVGLMRGQTSWTTGRIGLPGVSSAYGIAYGNGRFVATLSGNSVNGVNPPAAAWSTDGVTWNPSTLTSPQQGSIVFTAGAFYLAGGNSILRSADGQTWATVYSSPNFNASFRGIATNGRSMLVGLSSNGANAYLYSSDLITWRSTPALPNLTNPGSTGNAFLSNPVFGLDRYFAPYDSIQTNRNLISAVATTDDGTTWTLTASVLPVRSQLASGNGRIVNLAFPDVYISTDGASFQRLTNAITLELGNSGPLLFSGGRFFLANTLTYSIDGLTWAPLAVATLPTSTSFAGIAYGRGRYVAVGRVAGTNQTDLVAVLPANAPPLFADIPNDRTILEGASTTFSATLDNPDITTTYQWKREGVVVPGSTAPTLTLARATLADAGRYICTVTNSLGSTSSDPALLTIIPAAQAGRIINLSVLTSLDTPDTDFTLGFVIGGAGTSGPKSLLVRAAGPSLAPFGITNFLPDPKLQFFANGTFAGENNDWLGTAALTTLIAQTGAFTYTGPTSADAAFSAANLTTAANTVVVSSATTGSGTGSVIAEVYDATPTAAVTATTPRLINVSVLKNISAGGTLTAGFVIGGLTSKTVLIRATGPALTPLGVPNVLADPRLTFYQTGTAVALATNDNWSGTQALKNAMSAVGAFPIDPVGKDAALLLTLQPGSYTAQATGTGSAAGAVLVEIYEVP